MGTCNLSRYRHQVITEKIALLTEATFAITSMVAGIGAGVTVPPGSGRGVGGTSGEAAVGAAAEGEKSLGAEKTSCPSQKAQGDTDGNSSSNASANANANANRGGMHFTSPTAARVPQNTLDLSP